MGKTEVKMKSIKTMPPVGYYRVTNLYVEPDTGKLVVEYDDALPKEE